jgi:hypothetical protein
VAYAERAGGSGLESDDDFGLDEVASFTSVPSNGTELPEGFDCWNAERPEFGPLLVLTEHASVPPNDGFFEPVAYIGAARDQTDDWYRLPWTRWSDR